MIRWRAVVPIKQGDMGKSRLAQLFDPAQRGDLVRRMADHVLDTLGGVAALDGIDVLSPRPFEGWRGAWHRDLGRGLNAELEAWRASVGAGPVLVVHADLPLLCAGDVEALLRAAQDHGAALAHDRARLGTNALAIADGRDMRYCFGIDSYRRHRAQYPAMATVAREGLMDDLDTPDDVQALCAVGAAI
jgi:2-phospho-L-lactate guanylyltransferase